MKFIISIVFTAILAAICEWMLPWWTIALVAFLMSLIMGMKGGRSFMMGFVGISLFWLITILFKDIQNEHILGHRMAQVFGGAPYPIFITLNVLLGGLLGGLSAWSAALISSKKVKTTSKIAGNSLLA